MKQYTLFWLTGEREIIEGETISDAFMKAGYSAGALGALDFYALGDNKDYVWNPSRKVWDKKENL